jgi:hypothetical protein
MHHGFVLCRPACPPLDVFVGLKMASVSPPSRPLEQSLLIVGTPPIHDKLEAIRATVASMRSTANGMRHELIEMCTQPASRSSSEASCHVVELHDAVMTAIERHQRRQALTARHAAAIARIEAASRLLATAGDGGDGHNDGAADESYLRDYTNDVLAAERRRMTQEEEALRDAVLRLRRRVEERDLASRSPSAASVGSRNHPQPL